MALRNILLIIVICVGILIFCGVIILEGLSFTNRYFHVHSEQNAYDKSFNQSSKENLVSDAVIERSVNVEENGSISPGKSTRVSENLQLRGLDGGKMPFASRKVKKRSKRRAPYKAGDEMFAWNFNINVTRYENSTPQIPIESDKNNATIFSAKNKNYLGMAVYVEGNGPEQNYNELKSAWDSVGTFIRSLFGDSVESLAPQIQETKKKGQVIFSLSGSLQTDSDSEVTQNPNLMEYNEGSGDEPLNSSGRYGRWLKLGIFGFGANSPDKTTNLPEESATKNTDSSNFSDKSGIDENLFNKDEDFLSSTNMQNSELSTEISNMSFESNSSTKPRHPVKHLIFNENTKKVSENSDKDFTIAQFELKSGTPENDECFGCDHSSINFKVTPNIENSIEDTVSEDISQTIALSLTDEELKVFCTNLVKQESWEHLSHTIINSGTEQVKSPEHESRSQNLQTHDILSLQNALEESAFKSVRDITEESFSITTDASASTSTMPVVHKRESRFIGWGILGFGSGRSALEIDDLTSDEPNLDTTEEIKNLPYILDCINHFRNKQNMKIFPKPIPMDMINDSNKLHDFENDVISSTLKDHQLQLLNSLSTSLNNSFEKSSDIDSENVIKPTIPDEGNIDSSDRNQINLSMKNELGTGSNSVTLNQATASDLNDNQLAAGSDTGNQGTTELQKDGRFFNFFGFGSGTSLEVVASSEDNGFFGSGEGRLLETSDSASGSDNSILRNEDSSQENDSFLPGNVHIFDSYNTDGFLEDAIATTSVHERRFWEILGFSGSGDGRLLNEDSTINPTEVIPVIENDCVNDCSIENNNTDYSYECSDLQCDFENPHNHTVVSEFSNEYSSMKETDCKDDCFHDTSELSYENITESIHIVSGTYDENLPSRDIHNFENCNDCSHETHAVSEKSYIRREANDPVSTEMSDITEILTEMEQTTKKSSRIFGPVFLTGSGAGGLLEDSGGPINLVEEDSTVKTPVLLSRRGRLDDTLDIYNESNRTQTFGPKILLEERIPRRRGRLDDVIPVSEQNPKEMKVQDDVASNIADINLETIDVSTQTTSLFSPKELADGDLSTFAVNLTDSPKAFSKRILPFPTIVFKTTTDPPPIFCVAANQCNAELNERCVMKDSSSICDCGRKFIRSKETGKCVVKKMLEASLKFPAEVFDEDLRNPYSSRYRQKKKDSIDTMLMLLRETPEVLRMVTEVDVTEFRAGSLIVVWVLVLAPENSTEAELAQDVQSDLNKALKYSELIQNAPLNTRNASLLSIFNNIDPCMSTELNYCSKNAECVRNSASSEGFVCLCKEGYLDTSINKEYPGEACEAFCPLDYCGTYGHCEVKDEVRQCLCSGWYFGDRCGISGIVVVAGFSANIVFIILAVILLILCKGRCKTRGYRGTQRFDPSEEAVISAVRSGRLTDVIALEENVAPRIAKFANISTPMQDLPVIQVTRPTLNESSISYDYDSTFDVTPTSGRIQNSMDQEPPTTV